LFECGQTSVVFELKETSACVERAVKIGREGVNENRTNLDIKGPAGHVSGIR